jgi:hypothetical protein
MTANINHDDNRYEQREQLFALKSFVDQVTTTALNQTTHCRSCMACYCDSLRRTTTLIELRQAPAQPLDIIVVSRFVALPLTRSPHHHLLPPLACRHSAVDTNSLTPVTKRSTPSSLFNLLDQANLLLSSSNQLHRLLSWRNSRIQSPLPMPPGRWS